MMKILDVETKKKITKFNEFFGYDFTKTDTK